MTPFQLAKSTLSIVRKGGNPSRSWEEVVSLCRRANEQAPWNELPSVNVERDIVAALHWLGSELKKLRAARGIYLGLDTLNMGDGDGHNLEIGGSSKCDPRNDKINWLFSGDLRYGHRHLIFGLYELQVVYSLPAWKSVFELCDYVFFLGYSGIVLAEAFDRLRTQRTLLPAWGFHDGDLFLLGRKEAGLFRRICK
jgi:hypothetical protein